MAKNNYTLLAVLSKRPVVEVPVCGHGHDEQRGDGFSQRSVERGLE